MTITERALKSMVEWDGLDASMWGFAMISLGSVVWLFAQEIFKNIGDFGTVLAWILGVSVISYCIGVGMRSLARRLVK
ncbi:hypothetical protein [Rhizobium sp. MHM7A]|uniref:hypothetical protein n=1 Tax=Rhizobium sp. MHM7A TaxID=2583233 RepID=UPI0011057898|nr:hypothetical protein [Rhizobium sp. MHM7A]TLX16083.1 hypothetical protein FFR93_01815 [Rhizobium sp. MHM7A]